MGIMLLCLIVSVSGVAYGASKGAGITVTPLDDEFAGQSAPLHTPPGPIGQSAGRPSGASGNEGAPGAAGVNGEYGGNADAGTPPAGNGHASSGSLTPGGDTQDSLVIAYLVDLARRQNKPCPSGATPPAPPSLMFSEPLCKAAQAVQGGAEPLAAMTEQGVHAARWRMFSAENAPAQRVVNGLRQAHCEALLEPYTHIGAYRDSGGWKIILATLGEKPAGGEAAPAQEAAQTAGENNRAPQQPANTAASAALAGEATAVALLGGLEPKEPERAAGISGQEARSLFMLLNDLRAKGGTCFNKKLPPAPALTFDAALQALAEKDAQTPPASGSLPDPTTGMLYKGSNVTKLTLKANSHASVALDVWMLGPSQCEALLSPLFTDVGAAYEDGRWVLMLGGMNKGVPSDK